MRRPPHIEPALVPQDCGLHMDTQQVCLQLANGKTLTIEQTGEAFAFSALPNTAQQIEAAQHLCELPETGRTSITVLGAARGVGGIDSWCTDVEEHLPPERRVRPQRALPHRAVKDEIKKSSLKRCFNELFLSRSKNHIFDLLNV